MKAVKTVMSDHFLLMKSWYGDYSKEDIDETVKEMEKEEEEDDPKESITDYIDDAKRHNAHLKLEIRSLDRTVEDYQAMSSCLQETLEYHLKFEKKVRNYRKALILKMREVLDIFVHMTDKNELEPKLIELNKLINKG